MVLVLVHYAEKPMGIRLLDRGAVRSVWSMPRWEVQSLHAPEFGPLFRFVEEQVPARASVALALADNGFGYPMFGPHLDRHVTVVPFGTTAHDVQAEWLVATPERAAEIDRSCWQEAFQSSVGSVFRHSGVCA
jgi:hypothetical protein